MANPCGPLNIRPLDCLTDSVTICNIDPIPVVVTLNCETDSVTVCPPASGGFEVSLDAPTLAALETITVLQGTTPWEVSGTFSTAAPLDWAINDAPAAAIAASTTRAAVVGSRHVATAVSVIICAESATAPTATNLTVTLRDGSSGVGTILMIWRIHVAADMLSKNIAQINLVGLNVVGTVNTPMTLEFDFGVINILEAVNLTGYTTP